MPAGRMRSGPAARGQCRATTSSASARRGRFSSRRTAGDMRVLLVSANQERSPDPVAPLGLCYVATATARARHEVSVLDLCFSTDLADDVAGAVAAARPEVIGLS